jgi:hypothetical protein
MDLLLILLILFFVFGVGTGPWWGYHHYGYVPSGFLWLVAIVCLVVWLSRRNRI